MHKSKTASLRLMNIIIGAFLAISIFIFVNIGFVVHYQDLNETYAMAEETTAFLKTECQKYINYIRGNSARSLQSLLDSADGLNEFFTPEQLADSDFLERFIWTEHLSGVIVLDGSLQPIAQADMDDKDSFKLWSSTIQQSGIRDILTYPNKSYIDHVNVAHTSYDIAAVASSDGDRLIFCYSCSQKPSSDPYEMTMKSVLENNSFYKNPTLVITDGTQVLSTNNTIVEELGTTQYQQLADSIDWKDDQFTRFSYQNVTYYGLRRVYNDYFVYAVYEAADVFTNRTNFIVLVFATYMLMGIVILAVQRYFDKLSISRMEKQLGIIDAISTSYSSTFLLHVDKIELEAIRPSARLNAIFEKHRNAYDFLFTVCRNEVAEEYCSTVMDFLDLDTVAQRLQSQTFLGNEVRDKYGAWYSISLIPQKYDESGKVQTVLVATRDVTAARQAEELSFKDKLTGLYNRNYMESRSGEFVRSGDFPVSLIMADCNYLKQTNDTLGHEYGDLLLQCVAHSIAQAIPKRCTAMRVGGDEFLILCPQCSATEAQQIIAAIETKLSEQKDGKLHPSVAFGVSTTEGGTFSFEQAFKAADHAMYQNKKASRAAR